MYGSIPNHPDYSTLKTVFGKMVTLISPAQIRLSFGRIKIDVTIRIEPMQGTTVNIPLRPRTITEPEWGQR